MSTGPLQWTQLLCELYVYATVPPVVFEIRDVLTGEVLRYCCCGLFHNYDAELLFVRQSCICGVKRTPQKAPEANIGKPQIQKSDINWASCHLIFALVLCLFPITLNSALNLSFVIKCPECTVCVTRHRHATQRHLDLQQPGGGVNHKPQPQNKG